MSADVDALRAARDMARKEWERRGMESRVFRKQLTDAQRLERVALRAYERARLQFVEAVEGREASL